MTFEDFMSARDLHTGETFEEFARERDYSYMDLQSDFAFAQKFGEVFDELRGVTRAEPIAVPA